MPAPAKPIEALYQARELVQWVASEARFAPPIGQEVATYDVAIASILDGVFSLLDDLTLGRSGSDAEHALRVRIALCDAIAVAHRQ